MYAESCDGGGGLPTKIGRHKAGISIVPPALLFGNLLLVIRLSTIDFRMSTNQRIFGSERFISSTSIGNVVCLNASPILASVSNLEKTNKNLGSSW